MAGLLILVWDSVANMCSNVTREGGWGQRGDGGGDGVDADGSDKPAKPFVAPKTGKGHEVLKVR